MRSSFKYANNKIFIYFFYFCTHSITVPVYDQFKAIYRYIQFVKKIFAHQKKYGKCDHHSRIPTTKSLYIFFIFAHIL